MPHLALLFVFIGYVTLTKKVVKTDQFILIKRHLVGIWEKTGANQVKGCLASYKLQKEPPGQFAKGTATCAADQTFGRMFYIAWNWTGMND